MSSLTPVAFDIETSGLEPGAVITVAGFRTELGSWLGLNTTGRDAEIDWLETAVEHESGSNIKLLVYSNETELLAGINNFASKHVDGNRHYITAYNGERWDGGFDLPFLRSSCARRNAEWPFPDIAYADTMDMIKRFHTGDATDLVGVYDALIGKESCDPFGESATAVDAHSSGEWVPLILHNLADIERTRELARLAGLYVPKSDFNMKSLAPPDL